MIARRRAYVQIVQVDVVGAQLLERSLNSLVDILRTTVQELLASLRMRRARYEAKLGRQEDLLALARLRQPVDVS